MSVVNIKEKTTIRKSYVTPYERVLRARRKDRPLITEYIERLFEDFIELQGDRLFREDQSLLCGIAMFHEIPVTVIGHRKGRTTEENLKYNFGMTSPEGYRKAVRLMKQAEKFGRPVITFIDTPGAYPGMEAESNGQSNAIAESIACMSRLQVPTIAIITGEGSSGGALAIGMADRVWMLENSVYSILSPEGFASILWKDPKRAEEASKVMKLTAGELKVMGLVDGVIRENSNLFSNIDLMIRRELHELGKLRPAALVKARNEKYARMNGGLI